MNQLRKGFVEVAPGVWARGDQVILVEVAKDGVRVVLEYPAPEQHFAVEIEDPPKWSQHVGYSLNVLSVKQDRA